MIPLARPFLGEAELQALSRVLESGQLVLGPRVQSFETALARRCRRKHCVAVSSGSAALSLALSAVGVGPGDQVVVPALTWPSPAHAVLQLGATLRLADVDPDHWNLSQSTLGELQRVRVVMAIAQFGNPAPTLELPEKVVLIEDAACAIGSELPTGMPCGSVGAIACLSFHPRKILTTGEGGACLTDDDELATRLRVLRNHGQVTSGVFERPAGNHRMTELAAALGEVQLAKLDAMVERRRQIARQMIEELGDTLVFQQENGKSNFQTLGALLPTRVERSAFLARCVSQDVQCGKLSYSLSQVGSIPASNVPVPNAEEIARRGVALPLFHEMNERQIATVCRVVKGALR